MDHPRPLFNLFSVFLNNNTFFNNKCKKASGTRIQTHDLFNTSLLPLPLDQGFFHPLTNDHCYNSLTNIPLIQRIIKIRLHFSFRKVGCKKVSGRLLKNLVLEKVLPLGINSRCSLSVISYNGNNMPPNNNYNNNYYNNNYYYNNCYYNNYYNKNYYNNNDYNNNTCYNNNINIYNTIISSNLTIYHHQNHQNLKKRF